MAESSFPKPDGKIFSEFMRAQSLAIHAKDQPPSNKKEWEERKAALRKAMFAAMGKFPDKDIPLEPKVLGVLKRNGYRIEKIVFQTRPDVFVTANAYVPEKGSEKVPAVLVVHGHWPWARMDPVVQARCLGLVKLGFFVLAVDAFGAGERNTNPGRGTYHGALYGSTLWPTGHTLLGMQVYDNRRAVDYLRSRPEVNGDKLGVTGASGGGNQTMYAGSLDERFGAVVPVCSVGTYQAYLHVPCCVCEVLPGALRFAEEGDVLALVAPRSLLVINASKDGFQFSPGEARKSIERARPVFKLNDAEARLRHDVFESGHDYNKEMREAMYGWMTQWLKGEGDGKPIPEPEIEIEKRKDMRCFPDGLRPRGFFFPPTFAGIEGRALVARWSENKPDHVEQWESNAVYLRNQLRKQVFGGFPKAMPSTAELGKPETEDGITTTSLLLQPEPGMPLPALLIKKETAKEKQPTCVFLQMKGKADILNQPLVKELLKRNWAVAAPDLRATGDTRVEGDAGSGAEDHNTAEQALWVGRPMLGQWVFDVQCLLDWLALQPGLDKRRVAVVGVGAAGIVAMCAAGLLEERVSSAAALGAPATFVTDQPYASIMRMGLLAPGILRLADIPQLAALAAPRTLVVAGAVTPQDKKLYKEEIEEAYDFTQDMYQLYKPAGKLLILEDINVEKIAEVL